MLTFEEHSEINEAIREEVPGARMVVTEPYDGVAPAAGLVVAMPAGAQLVSPYDDDAKAAAPFPVTTAEETKAQALMAARYLSRFMTAV